jgi:hypothetical protein
MRTPTSLRTGIPTRICIASAERSIDAMKKNLERWCEFFV